MQDGLIASDMLDSAQNLHARDLGLDCNTESREIHLQRAKTKGHSAKCTGWQTMTSSTLTLLQGLEKTILAKYSVILFCDIGLFCSKVTPFKHYSSHSFLLMFNRGIIVMEFGKR